MSTPEPSVVDELRELVQQSRPARKRDGFPAEVKLRVVRWAIQGRSAGRSFHALATSVGLSRRTLCAWCNEDAKPRVDKNASLNTGGWLPVDVDCHPPSQSHSLRWATPSGHVVEGLSLDDVVRLLTVVP